MINEKTGLQCCFCGENIVSSDINPCDINILTHWDKSIKKQNNQTFWCHLQNCLGRGYILDVCPRLLVDLLSQDEK